MASFAKMTFNVKAYLACRPSYPKRVYDIIQAYHAHPNGGHEHLLDLGCGPGFMALALSPSFTRTTALDPSSKMVSIGLQPPAPATPIHYAVGSAEDLSALAVGGETGGVDLVVAGQAAHWFDHEKTWRELGRVVKPGGTVAYVGYAEMLFPSNPTLTPLFSQFSSQIIGPYWSQPGRSIVEGLLDAVPFPVTPTRLSVDVEGVTGVTPASLEREPTLSGEWQRGGEEAGWDSSTAVRLKYDPASKDPLIMRHRWTLSQLDSYFRTLSATHDYLSANLDDAAKRASHDDGKAVGAEDGDAVDRVVWEIRKGLEKEGAVDGDGEGEFDVGWPLVVMMIKKKV
ncbi:hypothetical protein IAT38_008385 [Cryptococcus sp. DSM 104549]